MMHNLLFVFALAIIGFVPMIEQTVLACWAYSCHLTMSECQIIVYFFLFFVSIYINFKVEQRDLAPDLYEMVGYFVLYIAYGFMLYFLGTSFWEYKSTGGLKGYDKSD